MDSSFGELVCMANVFEEKSAGTLSKIEYLRSCFPLSTVKAQNRNTIMLNSENRRENHPKSLFLLVLLMEYPPAG
jgi:hypothetical protein